MQKKTIIGHTRESRPCLYILFKEISGNISVYSVLGGPNANIRGNISHEPMFELNYVLAEISAASKCFV
jgi:hypothetical protein